MTDVSFDSLLLTVDQFIKKLLESIDKWYKKNNQNGEMDNITTTVMNESNQFFQLFYEQPAKIDINDLKDCLRLFCSINAHEIIRRFCNKHPDLVDFSLLLPEALASLNLDTVKVLVNAGADVNINIMLYRDQDMDATIFGPPIFYPLLALLFGPLMFLRIPAIECIDLFRPDHPKLIDIMMYLLNSGANPELSPMHFPWEVSELDLNRKDIETLNNIKNFSKEINEGTEEAKVFSKTFQDFLEKIENSSSATKFNKPPASLHEIKSFIQFIKTQLADNNSNHNENIPSQKCDSENEPDQNVILRWS